MYIYIAAGGFSFVCSDSPVATIYRTNCENHTQAADVRAGGQRAGGRTYRRAGGQAGGQSVERTVGRMGGRPVHNSKLHKRRAML